MLEVVQSEPLGAQAGAITHHPDHKLLYIATQEGRGFVYAVNDEGRIEKVRETPFKSGYCFLSLDRSGRYLLGVSYESGNLDVYRLDADGLPEKLVDSRNEKKTKAHSVGVSSDNRSVYVPLCQRGERPLPVPLRPGDRQTEPRCAGSTSNCRMRSGRVTWRSTRPSRTSISATSNSSASAHTRSAPGAACNRLQICAAVGDAASGGDGRIGHRHHSRRAVSLRRGARFRQTPQRGVRLCDRGGRKVDITRHDGNRQHPLGAWDVAARRSPVRHLLRSRFPRRVCHRQQRRPEEEASVKIGERFWDILVLGDASE